MRTLTLTVLLAAAWALGGCTAGRMSQAEFDAFRANADATVEEFRTSHGETIDNSAGYAVFPFVGKAGAGLSLAFGRGVVYAEGVPIGLTGFNAATLGFSLGGQAYDQIVLLATAEDVEKFTGGRWTGGAHANAVFGPWGIAGDTDFRSGQDLITDDNRGLMYEASLGLHKYNYRSLEDAIKTEAPADGG